MFQPERQAQIMQHLAQHDFLSVQEAIRRFSASPATIRRDFDDLVSRGLARRTHGGVCPARPEDTLPFAYRETRHAAEKAALARAAVTLLESGDVLFVDGGTTTFHLSECLPNLPLTLITNSLRLAAALEPRMTGGSLPRLELFLTGGQVKPGTGLLAGPGAQKSVEQYRARWAFLSAGGISPDGLFNSDERVAETERMMINNADQVVVLVDPSKIGRTALCRVAPLERISVLVTMDGPANAVLDACRKKKLRILSVKE
jgi:DeoR/GlpR family transcriptional regulator of sugar metabolism